MGTHPKRSVSATSVPRHTSNWSFSVTGEQRQISFQDKDSEKRTISKKRGHQRQKSCSGRSRRATGSLHRNAVRGYGGAGCGMRGEGAKRSEGAKERRGADAGVSAGAKVHGVRRVSVQVRGRRRVSVQVQVQVQARARARGVGSEECRCGAQKSVAAGLRRASV